MKYVGEVIDEIRRDTRNEDAPSVDETVGISTEDFLRYANFAREMLVGQIIAAKADIFRAQVEIDLVSGQMAYTIPDNLYLNSHVLMVWYSPTGLARDYYQIPERSVSKRTDYPGTPSFYIRQAGSLLLCPIYNSSGATIRVLYERMPDALDIRRGQVLSRTIGATALTALSIDPSSDTFDADALERAQYLCVCDAFGNVKMYNIPVDSINTTTGVVTIDGGSFTFADGETVAVGDYVTIGRYTTTHIMPPLPDPQSERYIQLYTAIKIFARDSSNDATEIKEQFNEAKQEILQGFKDVPRDSEDIEISNPHLLLGTD